MKQGIYTVLDNVKIAERIYRMRLQGETEGMLAGQFVNILLPGRFLRRPISICDAENGILTLIYKVVGDGTRDMAQLQKGYQLDLLTCLGNGYDLSLAGDAPLLLGGGVGIPPLYLTAKKLREAGKKVKVILGFNTIAELFYEKEFQNLGCEVTVTTVDGSYGLKGFVTAALDGKQSYYYACGPLPMLKAIIKTVGENGEVSMEERMGCGFGVCVGCTLQTKNGFKRVCKDGPVFKSGELMVNEG